MKTISSLLHMFHITAKLKYAGLCAQFEIVEIRGQNRELGMLVKIIIAGDGPNYKMECSLSVVSRFVPTE